MGGGTEASVRWRKMRDITDSRVKVARLPPPTQWRKNGGKAPQGATAAKRTLPHIQIKDAAQQPGPTPVGCASLRFVALHTLLARWGNDRRLERAIRRHTPRIAHQVRTRQSTMAASFSSSSTGTSFMPVVP
jgi:hypothetical protein